MHTYLRNDALECDDWLPQDYDVEAPRTITAISGNTITLDSPTTQAIETQYGGGEVYRYTFNGAIRQCGIERIRLESTFTSPTDENHGWEAVRFRQAENGWARQVTARHYAYSCVNAWIHAKNITVEDCAMIDPVSTVDGGRRYSFVSDRSSSVLFQRCYSRSGRHDYVVQARTLGPTAYVDSLAENTLSDIGPHQRYAEGFLFDNIKGGEIAVQNRGSSGSGHGWSGAQVVLWNCEGTQLRADAPKGAMNFAIGCKGTKTQGNPWTIGNEPFGIWESLNTPVNPRSLYYKQLEDRLGTLAMFTVTTQAQRSGNIFASLSTWQGNSTAPGSPTWAPVQVAVFDGGALPNGAGHTVNAAVRNPLPSNYPTTGGWTQISGPGTASFANPSAVSTPVAFPVAGTYVLQFSASQTDSAIPATYSSSNTVTINAAASTSGFNLTWDAGGANNNWTTVANWDLNVDPMDSFITFNALGALPSGTTNMVDASKSITALTYNFESATTQHTTNIAAGQTLAVAGDFLLAGSVTAASPTNVTLTGSTGALTVGGTSFQVGQTNATSGSVNNSLDMSGLGSLTANLGATGTFRVGPNTNLTFGPLVRLKLAAATNITTDVLGVGDRSGRGGTHVMKLGSGANSIKTNTLNVGSIAGRGNGDLSFETGTGSLLLRAADGTSPVSTFNLVNTSFGTGNLLSATVDFTGHSVDARVGALNMGIRTGTSAGSNATFSFDSGILEVATTTLGRNANGSNAGTTNATINIGGGTASFAAINMATSTAAAGSTTNASLNLTGGITTVTEDIVKIGGTGTTSATVSLTGGTLDMTDGNIGDVTNPVSLNLQAGTLMNVSEINGGGGLSKFGSSSFTFSGPNTFTGGINMFGGEVKITDSGSFGIGAKNLNIQVGAYVNLDGTAGDISLASGIDMTTAGLSLLNSVGNNTINGNISVIAGSGITEVTSDGGSLGIAGGVSNGTAANRTLQLSGTSTGANTVSGIISNGSGVINVLKSGTGTWALTNSGNTYTGNTTVQEGVLSVSTPNFDDASTVTIASTAILNLPNAGTDTVGTLIIGGFEQAAGKTYGNASSVLPVIATSAITGPGTITIPGGPGTPYSNWADTFLPGNDVSNPAGDNDNDGLVNQKEFAFGLSPISGSSVNPILVQLNKTAGTFTYQRRAGTGLTYRILTSTNLVSWPEDLTAGQVAGPVDGNGNETVVVTLTGAPLTAPKLFVRVAAD
jgi:autotransporter-associated beta strand protein